MGPSELRRVPSVCHLCSAPAKRPCPSVAITCSRLSRKRFLAVGPDNLQKIQKGLRAVELHSVSGMGRRPDTDPPVARRDAQGMRTGGF